jgi:hypothetical protein
MFDSIKSSLGWKEAPEASPVSILGVRIPADGTPAHLLHLTTTNDCGGGLSFLHRVPDTRRYWPGKESWAYRDLNRLDCQLNETVTRMRHLQQKDHSDQEAAMRKNSSTNEQLEVSQRQRQLFFEQQHHLLPQRYSSCIGAYYVYYSLDVDHLPLNAFVPDWTRTVGDKTARQYWGDVFIVKMGPHEYGLYGWAAYEDITPDFLELLAAGPLKSWREDVGFRLPWEASDNRSQALISKLYAICV